MKEEAHNTRQETDNTKAGYLASIERILELYVGDTRDKDEEGEEGYSLFRQDFLELEAKERLQIMERFLNYVKPKMQAVQANTGAKIRTSLEKQLVDMLRQEDNQN